MSLPSVGFIGAGLMGAGMAGCLLSAGHSLGLLTHRNRKPILPLLDRGASEAADATALVRRSDVVFTCVPDANTVEALAEIIIPNMREGQIWIDTTTSRPRTSERIASEMAARGAIFADAPVTGGPPQARDGTLASLIGCEENHFATIEPLVGTYSKVVRRFGPPGRGHAAKLLNNLVTQGTMLLLADAYQAAERYGIDARTLYEVMMTGAARSGTLEKAVGPALDGRYDGARFSIANAAKDLAYARDLLAEIAPDRTDIAASLSKRLSAAVEKGHGAEFVSSMLDPRPK